ncbi:MAG: hypothetical protein ACE5H3_04195 [Planctomycetota bacterium]
MEKAPAAVVQKEHDRLLKLQKELKRIRDSLSALGDS